MDRFSRTFSCSARHIRKGKLVSPVQPIHVDRIFRNMKKNRRAPRGSPSPGATLLTPHGITECADQVNGLADLWIKLNSKAARCQFANPCFARGGAAQFTKEPKLQPAGAFSVVAGPTINRPHCRTSHPAARRTRCCCSSHAAPQRSSPRSVATAQSPARWSRWRPKDPD
jgi:hypothetical protein